MRTPKQAKELSLKVWTWLANHPGMSKSDLPQTLWKCIVGDTSMCPLCTLYQWNGRCRPGCPLNKPRIACHLSRSLFLKWDRNVHHLDDSKVTEASTRAAAKIRDIIAAWEPESK